MTELARTWKTTPWRCAGGSHRDGAYHGRYHVDLAGEHDPRAPHRPLVHGSTLYQITEFHAGATVLLAYRGGHHPALAREPRLPWSEVRRRFMLVSLGLALHRPVFTSPVPLRTTITRVTDKWDRHRMVFLDLATDVADGAHTAAMTVCLNLRDDLIGA